MSLSLNEVEATCKRAARGSGLPWGLADEAGKSARWLCAFGLPGAELLASLLELNDKASVDKVSPVSLKEETWHAPAGQLSPLIAGASLCDCAQRLRERGPLQLENVSMPLLTVPFMAAAAVRLKTPVSVRWGDVHLITDGNNLSVQGEPEALEARHTGKLTIAAATAMPGGRAPHSRAEISSEVWTRLTVLGHRTFAPSTEESRLRGAGSGLSDND